MQTEEMTLAVQEKVCVKIIAKSDAFIPVYSSQEAAGADLRACIEEPITLETGKTVCVPTGIFLEIPYGFEGQVRPRSGLARKHGITVLNSPGTIDSDYRGEVGIILINHGPTFQIEPKMRIAQLVIAPVVQANFLETKTLEDSKRAEGGFGHTGLV